MVSFKASTSKISALSAIEQKHRRRISLNLPINVSTSPRPTTPPPSTPDASSPVPTRKPDEQAAIYKAEKELEYKHRHTFIGTASLNDFLDILEVSPSHMTTKAHIAQAFILLASSEQLHARQTSTSPEGWEFVTRTTHDLVCGPHEDYLNQARIMLGSISLGEFLRMMPFDEEGNVGALSMVEAFCAASHLDAKATAGVGSKAKAFRSWMVRGRDE
ncbi:hypothetical protein K458DRAFT_418582 [Lentithecium fluviatile CBS 122367]|uniref:Uncharacterized protein n=1 Tax=Lentithecium fluviatile CBS 122367 TaxID=1168545 RepID=A0A6G1IZN7_9PLEO|nr:hypothetical protein K458DRAFT_418582 [Lentithecium fluviatile CBS 122367]